MAAVGVISVDMEARLAKLEAGLKMGERKVQESAGRLAKAGKFDLFGKIGEQGVKAFVGLKAIEGTMNIITAASEAFQGNWEAAGQAARSFPILGPVADSLANMLTSLMGWNSEMKELREEQARLSKDIADSEKTIARLRAEREAKASGGQQLRDIERQAGLRGAIAGERDPLQRRLMEIGEDEGRRIRSALDIGNQTGANASAATIAITQEMNALRAAAREEHFASLEKTRTRISDRLASFFDGVAEDAEKEAKELAARQAEATVDRVRFRDRFSSFLRERNKRSDGLLSGGMDSLGATQVMISRMASQRGDIKAPPNPQIDATNKILNEHKKIFEDIRTNTKPNPFQQEVFA